MSPVAFLALTLLLYLTVKGRLGVYVDLATVSATPKETAKTDIKPMTRGIVTPSAGNGFEATVINPQGLLDNWFGTLSDANRALVGSIFNLNTGPVTGHSP